MKYKLYTINDVFIEESSDIPDNFTGIGKYSNGTKVWFFKGKPHRLNGPAIEYNNGVKHWCVNGKLHRLGGPAKEFHNNEYKEWFVNDKHVTKEQHDLLYSIMKLKGLL